jgi:hypothetical protein
MYPVMQFEVQRSFAPFNRLKTHKKHLTRITFENSVLSGQVTPLLGYKTN